LLRLIGSATVTFLVPTTAARSQSTQILTRPIPHTGEALPVVGLGTAVNFEAAGDPATQVQLAAVLEALVGGGGKLVDTASSYGAAEDVLGSLITQASLRPRLFLATKLEAHEIAEGQPALQRSLQRLKTDRLDLLMLHNVRRPDESLATLRSWQAAGTVRYVGISTSSTRAFEAVEAVMQREKPDFVEVNYSLDDREAEARVIPTAADLGIGVIIDLPFGRGRLFRAVRGRQLPDWAADFDARSWAQFFLKDLIGNPAWRVKPDR
jgi:aryl-alcohol dehydrogenase-like predicted oxidoreductase